MVLLGAFINGLEAFIGGVIGLAFKGKVPDDLGDLLLKGQGLCVVLVGIQGMMAGGNVVVVTLSMALGCLLGHAANLDDRVCRLGGWAQARLDSAFASRKRLGSFSEGFVASTLFTCTGAMAIVGSLSSGIRLDHSTLVTKGLIDLVVCIPLAATMGIGVPFCALSLIAYEGVLSLLAAALGSVLTQAIIAEVATVGSLLLLAVGANLLKIADLKVANMLPAAFVPIALVPLLSVLGLL